MRSFGHGLLLSAFVVSAVGCQHTAAKTDVQLSWFDTVETHPDKAKTIVQVKPGAAAPALVVNVPKAVDKPGPEIVLKPREVSVPAVVTPPLEQPAPVLILPVTEITRSTPPATSSPTTIQGGHAANYSWVVGEVSYSAAKKVWRLRYAGLGEEDDFGGSVTLQGSAEVFERLTEGRRVRVDGVLLQRDRVTAPLYRVLTLELVD